MKVEAKSRSRYSNRILSRWNLPCATNSRMFRIAFRDDAFAGNKGDKWGEQKAGDSSRTMRATIRNFRRRDDVGTAWTWTSHCRARQRAHFHFSWIHDPRRANDLLTHRTVYLALPPHRLALARQGRPSRRYLTNNYILPFLFLTFPVIRKLSRRTRGSNPSTSSMVWIPFTRTFNFW